MLRAPCKHAWYEPHTITGSGGQHCKGGQPLTVAEVVQWLETHRGDPEVERDREKPPSRQERLL